MERFFKSEWLNQAISDLKIKRYTDIQFKTIPSILKNNNTIGVSETGTGKTYAYLFPILEKINTSLNNIQAIIILPTRELANQIYSRSIYFKKYNKDLKIKLLVGGSETEIVNKKIENNPPHILITTPQKFQELNSNFKLVLTNLNYIVLDEADMLIDLGFFGLIETIFNSIKNINNITKVAFSATLHEKLSIQLSKYFKNSKIFDVTTNIWTHKKINHHVIHYGNANKIEVLKKLLQKLNPYFCIIFANTKKDVDQIFDVLVEIEPNNIAKLHGDLTSRERKNTYNGNEEITFVKMYELPFPQFKTEEDYWNSYTMQGTPEEISHYDFLTREIFVSSYSLAKIDMYNRRIKTYQKLLGFMGNGNTAKNGMTRDEANQKIAEFQDLKKQEEDKMLTIGFDMSNVYFAVGNQAIMDGNYERAAAMFEELIKLEKLIYPAYFNLTASYEYLARSKDTPYDKEAEYLNKAKDTLVRAEKTFHRGKDMGDAAREQNQTYQQIKQFMARIDAQLKTTRQQADALKEQAMKEDTFESYSSYANYIYQNRQDIEETLWAKLEAKKRARNKDQLVNVNKDISILYANVGDITSSINTLNDTLKMPDLTKDQRTGLEFDLANIYLNNKMYDEAVSTYSKYTNELTQDGAFALYAIGHIYIEQNKIVEALNIYNDFKRIMSPLAATNDVIANLDKDVESRRLQIMQYLGTMNMGQ